MQSKTQIEQAEEKLRLAMQQSDIEMLDELLAPTLIFTNHLGHVLTKQDDLNSHISGVLKIDVIKPSNQSIQIIGEVAIVAVQILLEGSYADVQSVANFRFTRVWTLSSNNKSQVIAAHSSIIAPV